MTIRYFLLFLALCVDVASAQDRIVYSHCAIGDHCDVILIKSDGRFPLNLTNNPYRTFSMSPTVSPDGKSVAFSGRQDPDHYNIFVMNLVTREVRQITNTFPYRVDSPSWSPDGRKIAYSRCDYNSVICDIYTINADGSGEPLPLSNSPQNDDRPRFSPDGSRVVFESNRSGNYDIWVCNSDGSQPQRLIGNAADDQFPNWSPDGTKIIFSSDRNFHLNLFLVNIDGSNFRQLTHDENLRNSDPSFSSNGRRVVWTQSFSGNPEIVEAAIDDMDHPRLLTDNFNNTRPYYGFVTRKVGHR